jgi:uncharacterized membrane protein YdbT with pleckstrin-like domain
MSKPTPDSNSSFDEIDEHSGRVVRRVTPALRPTVVLFVAVLVAGTVVVGSLITNPDAIANEPVLTRLAWNATSVIVGLVLLRLALQIALLRRTHYIVRTDKLIRETDLVVQFRSREVPLGQLRGYEYSQNVIQRLLGYGDIRILTAGTNRSLGFLRFEDIPNPRAVRRDIESIRRDMSTDTNPRTVSHRTNGQSEPGEDRDIPAK